MALVQQRRVSLGDLLSGTLRELARVKREIAVYLLIFLLAGLIVDFVDILSAPVGLLSTIAYFVGQYWLYREMLARGGIPHAPEFKAFSFFLMAVILGLPIGVGLQFVIVPGILLASKWIMAPAYLVAEDINLFEAIGASWRASSYNLVSIALAFAIIVFGWLIALGVLGGAAGALSHALSGGNGFGAFSWLLFHLLPVALMGLSVAAYRALGDGERSLVAVFE